MHHLPSSSLYLIGNNAPYELPTPSIGINRDNFILISMPDIDGRKIVVVVCTKLYFPCSLPLDCFKCVTLMGGMGCDCNITHITK